MLHVRRKRKRKRKPSQTRLQIVVDLKSSLERK